MHALLHACRVLDRAVDDHIDSSTLSRLSRQGNACASAQEQAAPSLERCIGTPVHVERLGHGEHLTPHTGLLKTSGKGASLHR